MMKIYLVGGAVRDRLLGRPPRERDFVVVGATPGELVALGFRQVGRDFPIFLHPETQEEYALARTLRRSAAGGDAPGAPPVVHADPGVTLREDLERRDLTINALALDEAGGLVDYFGGAADLDRRILRHVGPAFAEDPIRVLRVARLMARLAELGFQVAPETLDLMRRMAGQDALDALVSERVWAETLKALETDDPVPYFETLRACDALGRVYPELDALWGVPQTPQWHPEVDTGVHSLMALRMAARLTRDPEVRFAALLHDLGKALTPPDRLPGHHGHEMGGLAPIRTLCRRIRAPDRFKSLALLAAQWHTHIHRADAQRSTTLLRVLEGCDALRRPERFAALLLVCEADYRGRGGAERPYPQAAAFLRWREAAAGIDTTLPDGIEPRRIPELIHRRRLAAIRAALETSPRPGAGVGGQGSGDKADTG